MRISSVVKTYGGRIVLKAESREFEPGRICAVIGANGSGKSTYLKAASGILKTDGQDGPPVDRKIRIGYLPQKCYAFGLSLRHNLMLNAGPDDSDPEGKAENLMKALKLEELSGLRATRLSGGEMQKMALARLLMKDYEAIFLDEPTASMDMESALLAENLIREYTRRANCVTVIVTHLAAQAARLSDDLIFLHRGEIKEAGSCRSTLSAPVSPELKQFLEFCGTGEKGNGNG